MKSVRKKSIIGGIILAAIIGLVAAGAQINPEYSVGEERPNSEVWNKRIAGPEFANDSILKSSPITLERNVQYKFEFVPMGDSPERIKISIDGVFSETFVLEKTLVDTGISKYYTWEYIGKENVLVSNQQCPNQKTCDYEITVERFGNLEGSVSISLSRVSI
jgi:hypothetical protein|tara:strand:- start:28 stop:513 length:486 start_codon:yes stop_codon:yes gene_type:complete